MPLFNCIYPRRRESLTPASHTNKITFDSSNQQSVFEKTFFKALEEDSTSILESLESNSLTEFNAKMSIYGTSVLILAIERSAHKVLQRLLKDFHWHTNTSVNPDRCVNALAKAIESNDATTLGIVIDKVEKDMNRVTEITALLERDGFIYSLHKERVSLTESMTLALKDLDLLRVNNTKARSIIEEALEEASVCYEAHQSILSDLARISKEEALKFS